MASVPLVCPACRHARDGRLEVRLLGPAEAGVRSCACGAAFPVVDGCAVVLRDLEGWLATEGADLLARRDLPAFGWLAALAGGSLARTERLRALYAASTEGELQTWLRRVARELPGPVLEAGSGIGALGRDDVVAIDLCFGLVAAHPTEQRVCGDLGDPPFLASAFSSVVLANVLDSARDPGLILAQADALLARGGTLVVTCPFAFDPAITARASWFTAEDLVAGLTGQRPFLGYALEYDIVERHDRLEWPLAVSDRLRHRHQALAVVARKR